MKSLNRRNFFMGAATAAASARVLGANNRVRVGQVGIGGRGRALLGVYGANPDAEITGVRDVNQAARERGAAIVRGSGGSAPKEFVQMRDLFSWNGVDAVVIATPNHWHALSTIWACQAGKDVYVEKPASHNVFESEQMQRAAVRCGRVVQVGMQSRSIAHKIRAIQLLHEGVIGKIYLAKGLCYKRRKSIGVTPATPVPPGIDWDAFLGPAPMRPFTMNRFAYNWHWFWDTGSGDIGNQGVHEMDIARWGLGKAELPKSVMVSGGKFIYEDDQETPNTLLAQFDYGDAMLVFEVRGLITSAEGNLPFSGGNVIGNLFYGSEGYMALDLEGFKVFKGEDHKLVMDQKHKEPVQWDPSPHAANFLNAVRSRNTSSLNGPIREGALSADLCHFANISYRVGRKLVWDSATRKFLGDPTASRILTREYRKGYEVLGDL
jgi:predicted dehydrogenase